MSEKIKVDVSIRYVATLRGQVEMTRAAYDAYCEEIDAARGWEAERVAEDIMDVAGLTFNDADYSDAEVDEFCEVAPSKAAP